MDLYLVRHTSVKAPAGLFYGVTDVPVSDSFEAEASEVKRRLEGIVFDKVCTSPLSRAARLASFCGYPDAVRDNRLLETDYGDWEQRPYVNDSDTLLQMWYDDWVNVRPPHGESFMDQYRRVSQFLEDMAASRLKSAAAFTHGGVLMCAAVHSGLYTFETLRNFKCGYGEILKLTL